MEWPLTPLGEDVFGPVMKYEKGHKFNLVLDASQVERLVALLLDATPNSGAGFCYKTQGWKGVEKHRG